MAFSAVLYLLLLSSSVLMRAGASDSSYSYATNTPFYGYYTARSHKTNHPATQKKSQQVHYTTAPAYRAPSTRKTYYVTESPQRKKSTHATAYVTSAKSHYSKVPTYTKAGSYASTKKNHYSTGHAPKVYLAPRPLYKRRTKKGPASAGYMKKRSHPTAKSKNQAQSKDYQSYKKSAAPVIYTKPAYKKSISRGEENQLCYKPNKRSQGAPGEIRFSLPPRGESVSNLRFQCFHFSSKVTLLLKTVHAVTDKLQFLDRIIGANFVQGARQFTNHREVVVEANRCATVTIREIRVYQVRINLLYTLQHKSTSSLSSFLTLFFRF